MGHERRRTSTGPDPAGSALGERELRRAAEVNEALAWEFHRKAGGPLSNPAIRHMEAVGVEACALARVGLERARWVRLQVAEAAALEEGGSSRDDLMHIALAVAWADGALTVLRAQALSRQASAAPGRH
jgi:hypothetical protein